MLAFISGFSQLSLGILGEYTVRMLKEVQGEPRYLIRDNIVSKGLAKEIAVVRPMEHASTEESHGA
jgi:hypothetical protein